jgi:DNA-binding transcriptional regulator LsrR (DeoR family)
MRPDRTSDNTARNQKIAQLYASETVTQEAMAARFGLTTVSVRKILRQMTEKGEG